MSEKKKNFINPHCYLVLSMIIFVIGVPFTQKKIDSWKEQKDLYAKNIFISEFQKIVGSISQDIYKVIQVIKKNKMIDTKEPNNGLEKIQTIYEDKIVATSANLHFLLTETVSDDKKPLKERHQTIRKKIIAGEDLWEETNNFMNNFNKNYINSLNKWQNLQILAYVIGLFFHVVGMWKLVGYEKNDTMLIKEIRVLIIRVNKLIKEKNKT